MLTYYIKEKLSQAESTSVHILWDEGSNSKCSSYYVVRLAFYALPDLARAVASEVRSSTGAVGAKIRRHKPKYPGRGYLTG